jgi:hypothetical protein
LKDYAIEQGTDEARAVWHPGDSLEGYLQVSSTLTATITGIHVFFEGLISPHHRSVETISPLDGIGTTRTWVLIDDADIFGIKVAALEHKVHFPEVNYVGCDS